MTRIRSCLAASLFLLAALPAGATTNEEAQAAAEAYAQAGVDQAVADLQELRFSALSRSAAAGMLRDVAGWASDNSEDAQEFIDLADAIEAEVSIDGLGDHQPLSRRLANLDDMLYRRLGAMIYTALGLQDLRTMNFGIPVVFQPRGDRRNHDRWDELEYRRHFVPFSGVVVFHAAKAACNYATQGQRFIGFFCGFAARKAREAFELRVAPDLSDRIYARATRSGGTGAELFVA